MLSYYAPAQLLLQQQPHHHHLKWLQKNYSLMLRFLLSAPALHHYHRLLLSYASCGSAPLRHHLQMLPPLPLLPLQMLLPLLTTCSSCSCTSTATTFRCSYPASTSSHCYPLPQLPPPAALLLLLRLILLLQLLQSRPCSSGRPPRR